MKRRNQKKILRQMSNTLNRASPTILSVLGAAGVIATAVFSAKAAPKALELIRADSRINHDGDPNAATKAEAVKACWKCYIPAAAIGVSTIACIFGANILNQRNQALLTSAYAMLDQSYKKYREAANKVYGTEADQSIQAQMAKDVYVSEDGYTVYSPDKDPCGEKVLFYDTYSQRYFESTMASVLNAEYHVNRNFVLRGDATVNEFYEFLGLEKLNNGDRIGWPADDFHEGGIMWLDFDNKLTKLDDDLECYVISTIFDPQPIIQF